MLVNVFLGGKRHHRTNWCVQVLIVMILNQARTIDEVPQHLFAIHGL
jgi:hypothetical protein